MSDKNDKYAIPEHESYQSCHVQGDDPEGYDAEDKNDTCAGCVEKFTCLPEAVAKPEVWGAKTVWSIDDDTEVAGVLGRTMSSARES